jgi:spermidine/putrescine transport system ATP-binding protein
VNAAADSIGHIHRHDAAPIAIGVRGVTKVFGSGGDSVRALDDVSLGIRENEFFTLLGPSGCGKTTLLRLIAGFEHQTRGSILLYGEDISTLPPFRRPVNTVFQNYALFPHMSVGENIGFGLKMLGKPPGEVDASVDEMLRLVRMEELKNRQPSQLSGGQQQRVALARALAPRPKVLLLDEPLSALDLKLRKEMQIELKRLQHETGITFVYVTHDQEEALTMSDRLAVISAGRVLQVGSPRDIYERPADRFVADFIGDTNFLTAMVESTTGSEAKLTLPSGASVTVTLPEGSETAAGHEVTVVVRPEHADLCDDETTATLHGTLANIVYFGTDTHYYVELAEGGEFTVRMQNTRANEADYALGSPVHIRLDADSVQVLKD